MAMDSMCDQTVGGAEIMATGAPEPGGMWLCAGASSDLDDGKPKAVELGGEGVLLCRLDGRVYALRDKCAHLGVPFSKRLRCFAHGTISCWYHGWTFRWDTGAFAGIVGKPGDASGAGHSVQTYAVRESGGEVFVYCAEADASAASSSRMKCND